MSRNGEINAVIGLQFGDEGKGRMIDYFAQNADIVARGTGGPNAGHAVQLNDGTEIDLHQVPSGVAYPSVINVMGGNMLVNPVSMFEDELTKLDQAGIKVGPGNLMVAAEAQLILPAHIEADEARENDSKKSQGSTKSGMAFAAMDKALREGVQAGQLVGMNYDQIVDMALARRDVLAGMFGLSRDKRHRAAAEAKAKQFAFNARQLCGYIEDAASFVSNEYNNGASILLEGAQGTGLGVNFGKYPNTASYPTGVSAIADGVGLGGRPLNRVVGVAKLIPSKVGGGNFVTRFEDPSLEEKFRGKPGAIDAERGKTTGRPRELGYFDLPMLRRGVELDAPTEIALTKADKVRLFGSYTKICVCYEHKTPLGEDRWLAVAPTSDRELARCSPIYKNMLSWGDCGSKAAEAYYRFIEDELGVPVTMVGTGPGRNDFIRRKK